MQVKKLYIILFVLFIVSSCQNPDKEKHVEILCNLINEDSLVTLKGTLNINSKDIIVFENIEKRNEFQRKIHLIPCSNNLKIKIINVYYYNFFKIE